MNAAVRMELIAKNSLVDMVVERIRGLIEQNRLQAGDRLPTESELVVRFGVSRGALREGVRRLETLGLLTVAHGRGMFVADGGQLANCIRLFRSAMGISPKDSLQFAEFRRILECHTARRAAELASAEDVAELEKLLEQKNREGPVDGVQWDWLFHRKLAEIAGNELVRNVLVVLQEFVVAGIWHTSRLPDDSTQRRKSHRLHRQILEAIRARDPDAAERAMHAHMDALVRSLQMIDGPQPAPRRKRGP